MQPFLPQREHAVMRVAREKQLQHLVEQARSRNIGEERRERSYRLTCLRLDFETAARREPCSAQHAHRVLAITLLRITDHAQPSLF